MIGTIGGKMRNLSRVLGLLFVLVVLTFTWQPINATPSQFEDVSGDYEWKRLAIGAGGYVPGIDIHPSGSPVYIRTDVSGGYRWDENSQTWINIVTDQTMPDVEPFNYPGVRSIVSAPSNAQRVYMAFAGAVYRSENQGNNWIKTSLQNVDFNANGDYRTQGEPLAVDPQNDDVVFFASEAGIGYTLDAGTTWTEIKPADLNINASDIVAMIPIFVPGSGTVNRNGVTVTRTIYLGVNEHGFYQSNDGGQTWTNTPANQLPINNRYEEAMTTADGTLYMIGTDPNGLWKKPLNGNWVDISTPGSSNRSVSVDPFNTQRILVHQAGGRGYRSTDGGANWVRFEREMTSPQIPWLGVEADIWISVGNAVFDPVVQNKLWMAHGFGVIVSQDLADDKITWTEIAVGTDILVSNDVVAPPGGPVITSHWDSPSFTHENLDDFPAEPGISTRFNSGWHLDYSEQNPNFVAIVVTDHRNCCAQDGLSNQSGFSTNGGRDWQRFASLENDTHPDGLKWGNVAIAANDTNNMVWLPSRQKPAYYTKDRGATWTEVTLPGQNSSDSHDNFFLRRHVLVSDRVQNNTFYLLKDFEVYRSTNGGENWTAMGSNLPTAGFLWKFNTVLASVPGKQGHLFLTPGVLDNRVDPMYKSTDGGATWVALDLENVSDVGFGKGLAGMDYPAVYAQGFLDDEPGLWRSLDGGTTWDKIATYPLGIYEKAQAITGDLQTFGRVYVGLGSNGFVYSDYTGNEVATCDNITRDFNDDGATTPADGVYVVNRVGSPLNGDTMPADVNGDGNIDSTDVDLVLGCLAEPILP